MVIPRKAASDSAQQQQPYVYLKCGHVQGHHDWGQEKDKVTRKCPMCLVAGAVVKLSMGIEPAFYVDNGPPTYAFSPCGHMATEKTVKLVIRMLYFETNILYIILLNCYLFFLLIDIGKKWPFHTAQTVISRSVPFAQFHSREHRDM